MTCIVNRSLTRPNNWLQALMVAIAFHWPITAQAHEVLGSDSLRFEVKTQCEERNVACEITIDAIGLFSKQSGQEFAAVIAQLPKNRTQTKIHFSSLGGNLSGAIQVGQLIREHEFITQTGFKESVCYSACAYAFMGGVIRELGPQAKFGLHQFYSKNNELSASSSQSVTAMLSLYLDIMGIDRKALQVALSTEPKRVTLISKSQAQLWMIDNSHQPYNPWKLETSERGQLVTLATQRQANRPWTVVLILTKMNGQERALIQLIQHGKKSDLQVFETTNFTPYLIFNQQKHSLITLSNWQSPKPGVIQRWCLIDARILRDLPRQNELIVAFNADEAILQELQIRPMTRFGTQNLNKNLLALGIH